MSAQAKPIEHQPTSMRCGTAFQDAAADGFRSATLNLPQADSSAVEIRYVDRDAWHSRANMPLFAITGWMMYLRRRSRQKLLRKRS
jgi:hypothetical protein